MPVVERRTWGQKGEKPIPGFAALGVIADASAASLKCFVRERIRTGSHILTGGWRGYRCLEAEGFPQAAFRQGPNAAAAHVLFPWVHITLSNLKRFLLGTHHQAELKHLKRFVAEFAYRHNRRRLSANLFQRLACACLATNINIYKDFGCAGSNLIFISFF